MKLSALRAAFMVAVGVALVVFLSHLSWGAIAAQLQQLGAAAPLLLLPYACVLSWDTLGWRFSFEHPRRMRYWMLWRVRAISEAVSNSAPAGIAMGETLKTVLLTRDGGISLTDAAANVIVSKVALAIAHAGFMLLGLWCGASVLSRHSQALIGRPGLLWLYALVVLGFLSVMLAAAFVAQSAALSRVLYALIRSSPQRVGRALEGLREPVSRLDASLAVIGRLPRRQVAGSIACFFFGWLALGCEDWLILSLLHARASLATAVSLEAIVSVVRMLFFFVPAGLGAQDVSYFALLKLWDTPDAEATAFMLLKRGKEACWIGLGYVLLWWRSGRRGRRMDVSLTPAPACAHPESPASLEGRNSAS